MKRTPPTSPRQRSPRGHGDKLRREIVDAAATLLDEAGTDQAVTLRAVARQVGISAPSIYAHFATREDIVVAVIQDAFGSLEEELAASAASATDPASRLRAVCEGYLDFALARPQRYRAMFSGLWDPISSPPPRAPTRTTGGSPPLIVGDAAFRVLEKAMQECIDSGASASDDAFADATVLWVGLHGLCQLRHAVPLFPWPRDVSERLVTELGKLR